jgi:hypothetical protein
MRWKQLLLVIGLVAFAPGLHAADPWTGADIVQVILSDFFESTLDQSLTETITTSFEFYQQPGATGYGRSSTQTGIMPGTLTVSATGFLPGTLTGGAVNPNGYIAFFDAGTSPDDEFDIRFANDGSDLVFDPGHNNLTYIYGCQTAACQAALGPDPYPLLTPTSQSETISAVAEPSAVESLAIETWTPLVLLLILRRRLGLRRT